MQNHQEEFNMISPWQVFGMYDAHFILLAVVFLGLGIYGLRAGEVLVGKAGNSGWVRRDENPFAYWFGVFTHILIGSFLIYVAIFGSPFS